MSFGVSATPVLAAAAGRSQVSADVLATSIPNVSVFGSTASDTPETVSFIFREQNLALLEARAQAGFGRYLSVAQFAATYGQPAGNVRALVSYLNGYGITTTVYPNNIDVVANGTAGEFDQALSVTQKNYATPAIHDAAAGTTLPAQSFHGIQSEPTLPTNIAQNLVAILGLTNYATATTNLRHTSAKLKAATASGISQSACVALTGLSADCNTPETFASRYGLNPLYQEGAEGQGETLGIVTYASADTGAAQYFWNNVLGINTSGRTVTYEQIDGGAGAPSFDAGSSETDLDVEQSGAVAPRANIVVYEAPNTDSGQIDALFTAATQNVADTISQSWGESETAIQAAIATGTETTGYVLANDEAFLEFDAQGQSSFVSSGDSGAYDASGDLGTTNLSVDSPGDSPYTTSAGGTTLPWSGVLTSTSSSATAQVTVPSERMWGWDYLWPAIAQITDVSLLAAAQGAIAGDGGGFSAVEPEPSYQYWVSGTNHYGAVQWLTPTDFTTANGIPLPTEFTLNQNAPLTFGFSAGRAVPDLATDADPYTGYLEYSPSFLDLGAGNTDLEGGWGGTSFVAPELNGSAAVIDSLLHRRVGLWNPQIYRFANSFSSPFTSLTATGTSNDNLYYTGLPGQKFNAGAGLGIPNFAELAADFARGWGF